MTEIFESKTHNNQPQWRCFKGEEWGGLGAENLPPPSPCLAASSPHVAPALFVRLSAHLFIWLVVALSLRPLSWWECIYIGRQHGYCNKEANSFCAVLCLAVGTNESIAFGFPSPQQCGHCPMSILLSPPSTNLTMTISGWVAILLCLRIQNLSMGQCSAYQRGRIQEQW